MSVSDLNPEAIEAALAQVGGRAAKSYAGEYFLVHGDIITAADAYASLLRRVQLGEVVLVEKVDGEWPREAIEAAQAAIRTLPHEERWDHEHYARSILDSLAASRGETPPLMTDTLPPHEGSRKPRG